jgi:hypothetical protein
MRAFVTYRSCLLAVALGVSALALGGCAVETASGDPTSTEEGKPAGTSASAAPAGENASTPAASSSAGAVLFPTRQPVGTSSRPGTESSADAVKAETSTESSNCSGNNCGNNQDGTQPLPWIQR